MLNPLRHLAGKLDHLHLPQGRYLRIIELANSIRPSSTASSLTEISQQQILALKSNTSHLDARTYHKFQFDYQVHHESAVYSLPSTIFDDLNPHQRKISHLISSYASKLNSRQMLYLNLAIRNKLNSQFPTWNSLHLCPQSPAKVDIQVLPTLEAASRITELKSMPKKIVIKQVIKAKQATNKNKNKMSIYSGFATRQQEQTYDNLILDLISVLQRRIIKFYVGQEADEPRFHTILNNIHHHLAKMQDNKYLDPKFSNSIRQLMTITATLNNNAEVPVLHPPSQQGTRKQYSAPKQSLNFSTDKISQDLKSYAIGKIRHQSTNKDELSSRGQANPQQIIDKNIPRAVSTNFPRQASRPPLQRWGALYDNDPPAVVSDQQKKNIQYIIREYVNKGQQRRRHKKRNGVD